MFRWYLERFHFSRVTYEIFPRSVIVKRRANENFFEREKQGKEGSCLFVHIVYFASDKSFYTSANHRASIGSRRNRIFSWQIREIREHPARQQVRLVFFILCCESPCTSEPEFQLDGRFLFPLESHTWLSPIELDRGQWPPVSSSCFARTSCKSDNDIPPICLYMYTCVVTSARTIGRSSYDPNRSIFGVVVLNVVYAISELQKDLNTTLVLTDWSRYGRNSLSFWKIQGIIMYKIDWLSFTDFM